ncbi:DUF2851 family protein [Aequorivita echinoideorum]|uniref:DUF2851 family protein n=1 Tax=Aequorivita echinoideorum TaxID=1549647 RepID=A0ABS5S6P4_9FLAO|nr:DUF2851 family protein [Aequorivita echinoideorum]MBT0608863.1 DUF2851 family protein [Aequorivita echinoideorum]
MKEDFLHYVWKFQVFGASGLTTADKEILQIIHPGSHNSNAGPDFVNAQIVLGAQHWAGNVEIHLKSSDWYAHKHEIDSAYENVILHVVWQHDAEIYRKDGSVIPTFILKNYLQPHTLQMYSKLFAKGNLWMNCENDFPGIDTFLIENWLERLYFERLQEKQGFILQELKESQNHWESLLFRMLCRNFGLKVNGTSFLSIAKSLDFSIVKKCMQDTLELEALLMGQAGLFEKDLEDWYFSSQKKRYDYQKRKYNLDNAHVIKPIFFRLRPPNFPTLRLSQLAVLYAERQNLFQEIIEVKKLEEFYDIFKVAANEYWDTHFNFGLSTMSRKKWFSKSFVDLLVINTIIPLKFCYAEKMGTDVTEEIIALSTEIASEDNKIIKKFNSLKPIARSAQQSQGLLQMKHFYCDKNRCLHCAVGNSLLRRG